MASPSASPVTCPARPLREATSRWTRTRTRPTARPTLPAAKGPAPPLARDNVEGAGHRQYRWAAPSERWVPRLKFELAWAMLTIMTMPLSPSAQKVQDALRERGLAHEVRESSTPTRTSADAARLVGCRVGQIAKSLIFRGRLTGRALLVIASGANRVSEPKLEAIVGEPVEKADADFVRQQTGFAIGGVPPIGHATALQTLVDRALLDHAEIWAAAGTPHSLFRLTPAELLAMTGACVVDIAGPVHS
jgi:prolyl-tRNA editing enzyme YbaK/EbsC (Cys-tRNA(Pro) deacylase)